MKYLNALNKISGIGTQKVKMLLSFFSNAENAWKADGKELAKSGIGEKLVQKIVTGRKTISPEEEWEKLEKENIKLITLTGELYPPLLKEINSPPYVLYVKSNLALEEIFKNSIFISIVGSRKFTSYGKQVALQFARELSQAGLTVVSGMAIGIDSFAHRGALEAGGKTIAVLGSSLEDENIGPRSNYELSRDIMDNGALISDYPLGIQSVPGNFPARNRLMAGLSRGVLVVEAALESGSLITANLALDFNREVFSIPGSIISPQSEGTNDLIKKGAKLTSSVKDILEELNIREIKTTERIKKIIPATKEEEIILKVLSPDPVHIDKITKLTKLETNVVSSTLSIMEMKGMIRNIGGQNYILL